MWQIPRPTLNGVSSSLHVDPEEVTQEWFLQIVVDIRMIDNPQQLIDRHNCLTHRLNETVLTLKEQEQPLQHNRPSDLHVLLASDSAYTFYKHLKTVL